MAEIAVIGAGAVGAAIASRLVRAGHRVTLLEGRGDVGAGTSKANTAIWHTGFDAKPGTMEARLVARGHTLLEERAEHFNWWLERTGAVLVAWSEEQLAQLDAIVSNAEAVGYARIVRLRVEEVYGLEPHLGAGVRGGLLVPDEGLLDPWTIAIALATDAEANGARVITDAKVEAITRDAQGYLLRTPRGEVRADWVVNAAGLGSDVIDRLLGLDAFTITPRRGQLIVFDKLASRLLSHILLPVPTKITKGVLVSPTVYGNVLLGPTAEDLADRSATETTEAGLQSLLREGARILPELVHEEVTATYAGLRAASEFADYCYEVMADAHYARVGGIRSTGISACLAIAEDLELQLAELGVVADPLVDPVTVRMPPLAEHALRPYQDGALIAADPAYGTVVCLCERVTLGEMRDALHSPLPAKDADGLRRRTRALAGRCQGFHCGAEVTRMLQERS